MKGFEIVRLIGRGATAEVFEARDGEGRTVALKVFPAGSRSLQWQAYVEADLLSNLDHPAILKVRRLGEEEQRPYMVMEFVDGTSLEGRVSEQGKLFQGDAVLMIRRIAEGLAHAHALGVVHGDLHPRNILLRRNDPRDPVICDFGLHAQGTQEQDSAALAELLRFAVGEHPLIAEIRTGSARSALEKIDRFLASERLGTAPPRKGCLGMWR